MSKYFSKKYEGLIPYTPGEQPQNRKYIKLNTNESPFPPSAKAISAACEEAEKLQLYSDPDCRVLRKKMAENLGISEDEIIFTNGSDDILNFAFMAFCDNGAAFPDITYGFYPVFAALNRIDADEIPLNKDFTINVSDYYGIGKTVFIANPNAPTGIALTIEQIRQIIENNPDNMVVIDEAYVDFGTESCVPLTKEYDNLLVTQTFSKSRSLAGMRIGYAFGSKKIIKYLSDAKFSFNSYTMNMPTLELGVAAVKDKAYFEECCKKVIATREWTKKELKALGFSFGDSKTNFIFVKHDTVSRQEIFTKLRERGIIVRALSGERIKDYLRISIGTDEEMKTVIEALKDILGK